MKYLLTLFLICFTVEAKVVKVRETDWRTIKKFLYSQMKFQEDVFLALQRLEKINEESCSAIKKQNKILKKFIVNKNVKRILKIKPIKTLKRK